MMLDYKSRVQYIAQYVVLRCFWAGFHDHPALIVMYTWRPWLYLYAVYTVLFNF